MEEQGLETEKENDNRLQTPAVRPPRKISKPKITLKMPTSPQIPAFYQTPGGMMTIPLTPVTGLSPNYPINFFQAYPNKAQEFMFKQFEGFKDFTMNTGKIGLNFGEKLAFWMYGKVRELSQNNVTHIALFLFMCFYCGVGGIIFHFVENDHDRTVINGRQNTEDKLIKDISHAIVTMRYLNESKVKAEIVKLSTFFKETYKLNTNQTGWDLMNSMYYCGTIFTTIGTTNLISKEGTYCKAVIDRT